jgi:hypothetical protein
MSGHVSCMMAIRNANKILFGILKEWDQSKDIGVDKSIILKFILKTKV